MQIVGLGFPQLKNDLIEARKLCSNFSFIDDLNVTNDDRKFEFIYCNICGEYLELGKNFTDTHDATFSEFKHQYTVQKVSNWPNS